eukprot:2816464-Ditylum_brightwellii.AAC.1
MERVFNVKDHLMEVAKSIILDTDTAKRYSLSQFATDDMMILINVLQQFQEEGNPNQQWAHAALQTKKDFLKTITDAAELFIWWMKEIPSTKEFKMFLKLAHSSAGESDYEVDRIHTLDHIGDALGGFLYSSFNIDLKHSDIFDECHTTNDNNNQL